MAKGLVGGVNSVTSNTSATSVTGTSGGESTYTARINNISAAPVEYTGRETDSMHINVDNTNRTISGEVKWRNMIASSASEEDAYHAYPANKARLNFEEINKSLTTLKSDVQSLEDSCDTSASTILKYVQDLANIEAELDNCKKYCAQLRASIDQEVSTRELDHVNLRRTASENFSTLKDDITNITNVTIERLDAQEGTLQSTREAVSLETSRAREEESRIEKSLQATNKFVSENKQGIASLRQDTNELIGRIQTLESVDIANQTVDHTAAIQELRQKLADTDFKLTGQYTTTSRETAKIRDIQYKHESEITDLTASWKTAERDVEDLRYDTDELKSGLESLRKDFDYTRDSNFNQHAQFIGSVRDEAQIRRETDLYHEEELKRLEVRISTLQTELTQVIQALANELRNRDSELQATLTNITYDFVDAGNAPV